MLASSFGDPVIGLDIHWEMVPTPAPTPLPIPNPFTGVVFDPVGLVVGLAITNIVGAVMGAPPSGPVIYWGAFPATNTGTDAKHVPGHILIPPGTAWAPVPKTPKPTIHPDETPKPPNPVKPEDDAVCVFGSKTVSVMGSNAVRFGDILLSCSEPVRLPSSVVMAVPKGGLIVIGGPPSLDLMAAIFASLRTRFMSDSLHALLSRMKPSRFRNLLSRVVCFLTGHPVDVATGRVLTDAVDIELPGPVPLRIYRSYSSGFASRSGVLGHGWSLSLDQAVWEERGRIVLLEEDGRELEFDTFDWPGHRLPVGSDLWHPIHRLTLRRLSETRWEVASHDGTIREFAAVAGRPDGRAMIQRQRVRLRPQDVLFRYDSRGRLAAVRDSCGRVIDLEHDTSDRVIALHLPHPNHAGSYVHRGYEYDAAGDLVGVRDALGGRWSFEYVSHLLTRETDRAGLSFYFAYDGIGEDAYCIRTWGDRGIYDHAIAYDKQNHATFVANSKAKTTRYKMNLAGLVVQVVDPLGAKFEYEYDERTFQNTKVVDPLGRVSTRTYDEAGNLIEFAEPGCAPVTVTYNEQHRPIAAIDAAGASWSCTYDHNGLLAALSGPSGTTELAWDHGLLVAVRQPGRMTLSVTYDDMNNVRTYREEGAVTAEYSHDRLGRNLGARVDDIDWLTFRYDLEGHVVQVTDPTGQVQDARFNAEGLLVDYRDATERIRYEYGHRHRLASIEQGGTATRFQYDTEGELVAIVNEAGQDHRFELDACGRTIAETTVDGRRRRVMRDVAGRVVKLVEPSRRTTALSYDDADRVIKVEHSDGARTEFEYRPDGRLLSARNDDVEVSYELDPAGRVLAEATGAERIDSWYEPSGRVGMRSSRGARMGIQRAGDGEPAALVLGAANLPGAVTRMLIERDHLGVEKSRTLGGGLQLRWQLDAAGRPAARSVLRLAEVGRPVLDRRAYQWRGLDRVVSITDSRHARVFDHDERGYATHEHLGAASVERVPDEAGNFYGTVDRSDRRYGIAGQLLWEKGTDFVYDPDGYLIERQEPNGRRWRYEWRAGMLREAESSDGIVARFEYDPFARRTRKVVARRGPDGDLEVQDDVRFVWDDHHLLHEVSDKRGTVTWYWKPDSFELIAREHLGHRWSIVTDLTGAVTDMYDDRGALVWQRSMNLHGEPTQHAGSAGDCPWRWPGAYHDPEIGLVYLRHRYLTESAVFISPDPLGTLGGPRAYGYVADPLVQSDPLGLHTVYPRLNNRPVPNPRLGGENLWPNVHGSGGNGPSPDGLGRAGDSENLLLRHLQAEHNAGRINLNGGFLEIESLRRGRFGALPPCAMCGEGLQRMANNYGMRIVYRETTGKGQLRTVLREYIYRPHTPRQEVELKRKGC